MDNIVIKEEQSNIRIDKFLNDYYPDFSRNHIKNCIVSGEILVNDKKVKAGYSLKAKDIISVLDIEPKEIELKAQDIPLDILYEDGDVLVVNKPKDMVVHPAPGHYDNTLVNAIMYYCKSDLSGINGEIRPGIVHRIDKDTTGSLIVCKNDKAHNYIAEQIKNHSILRRYIGICHGHFGTPEGVIDKPIGRSSNDRKKMCVNAKNSKEACTLYRVISQNEKYSLVEFTLKTGRTHQIRVHMSSINHPLLGDEVYGAKNTQKSICGVNLIGQCLHAKTIGFNLPSDNSYIEIEAPVPGYMETLIEKLNLK